MTELRNLLSDYLAALERLRPFAIQSLSDYAEYVFAQAFNGKRGTRGQKGHDVLVPNLGRVQVKQRCLPADGRIEERLHCRNIACDSCDYVGAVIFNNDLTIRKATLVPHAEVWKLIADHPDPEKKIRFDLVASLPGAVNVTDRLRHVIE